MSEERPQGAPTESELRAMEFDDLSEMLRVLFDECEVDTSSVDFSSAMVDKVISFHIGRVRINTRPDESGKMRFTDDAIRVLVKTKA